MTLYPIRINLNQQNPASLEIGKKDFDDTVPHQNQQKDSNENAVSIQGSQCSSGHIADSFCMGGSRNSGREASLEVNAKFIQFDRYCGKQTGGKKSLQTSQGQIPDRCGPPGLIFQRGLKNGYYKSHTIERPAEVTKELHHSLHPDQLKELASHAVHHVEELGKELHNLSIDPVENLSKNGIRYKVPDEQ